MSLVLVTGGAGFIGANLLRQLDSAHEVRVLDNLVRGSRELLPADRDIDLVVGDIRDPDAVARATRGVDLVIHLAAFGSVVESVTDPVENFEINARGTFEMLRGAADAGVERFIFASTGGAIMGDQEPPIDERSLPWPISPYGASKLCGEAYLHAFAGSFGIRPVALRFANVYGPYSAHKKGVITRFIRAALAGGTFEIFGEGKASRDFLHVDDLCRGILAAAESDLSDEVLHLASEKETTINELAELIIDIAGADVEVVHHPKRPGEVERNFARADRARELLGWEPQLSLREGMMDTVEWFRAHDRVSA
ncbi:MAG TPA: NAD-dependent epimerase/dehydratase family protein [Thermoleophilaceae bacterium]|jgi:UDP-glucose 4-epimerase|nr:NAD-dependent epimerase/dehydratase family protein [Thermoleophilaceae bacterium]